MLPTGFDPELIRRYDVNGPRYTSYPTANLFSESFDPDAYVQALHGLAPQAALSLYLHVPFCATICYYCACNKIVTNNRRHAARYLGYLLREMAMVAEHVPSGHGVEQLHFGGGTPTYLSDDQFRELFASLRRHFNLTDDGARDYSIEIDPRTVNPERMRLLMDMGINRVSLGIQDFDPEVQAAVNRIQSVADTRAIIDAARARSVQSVSVDLIYGLPLQTPERFARTLHSVLDLAPDRISLYSYAHLPQRFKTQRQINVVDLPAADTKLRLFSLAMETLQDSGYAYIGMDHFARTDDTLVRAQNDGTLQRNFQGYTTHGECQLIGLGVSAIGNVGDVYVQNHKDLDGYCRLLDKGRLPVERGLQRSAEDRLRHDVIGRLMCHLYLDKADVEARHGIEFDRHFAAELERLAVLEQDGLVRLKSRTIEVTPTGRFLIRQVCMPFDAYLPADVAGFSKAI